MFVKAEQFSKHPSGILVSDDGSVTFCRFLHPMKHSSPNCVTELGMEIEERAVQFMKQSALSFVREDGN